MRNRFARHLIAFALIVTVGGHWAILQSVAWFGMVISYSQDSSFSVAVIKTFDGKHPCNLCKLVREGKKAEKKSDVLKVETKFDLWLVQTSRLLYPPAPFAVLSGGPDASKLRAESPPTPPPRLA